MSNKANAKWLILKNVPDIGKCVGITKQTVLNLKKRHISSLLACFCATGIEVTRKTLSLSLCRVPNLQQFYMHTFQFKCH